MVSWLNQVKRKGLSFSRKYNNVIFNFYQLISKYLLSITFRQFTLSKKYKPLASDRMRVWFQYTGPILIDLSYY